MAVVAMHPSAYERADDGPLAQAVRLISRYIPLAAIIGLVVGIHIPTLSYFFFGDDFLVLGDIQTRTFPQYARDVFLLDDLTPNWRPLTMLAYWAEFRLFGFDATAWRIVNLVFHALTVVVLYQFLLSLSGRVFVAAASALIFGVSASAVHTVTYITAFPHVFSQFFLVSSLYALHSYVQRGEKHAGLYWLSLLLYIAGFLSNEGGVVFGVAIALYYGLYSLPHRRDLLDYAVKMTPFALSGGLMVVALAGSGKQGVETEFYTFGWHIARETWVYLTRMAYPVGQIPLDPGVLEWAIGSAVLAAAFLLLITGPNIARVAAVAMVAALMPYAPGKIWTATRYTYMALPFFGILVAVAAGFVHEHLAQVSKPVAHVLAAAALAAVGGLYAWQTVIQTEPFLEDTERWELLVAELRDAYPDVEAGETVYIIDDEGLWTNPFWQPTWMTSVGRALYGDGVSVRAIAPEHLPALEDSLEEPALFVELRDGKLQRVPPETVAQRLGQQE